MLADRNGNLLLTPEARNQRWHEYGTELFSTPTPIAPHVMHTLSDTSLFTAPLQTTASNATHTASHSPQQPTTSATPPPLATPPLSATLLPLATLPPLTTPPPSATPVPSASLAPPATPAPSATLSPSATFPPPILPAPSSPPPEPLPLDPPPYPEPTFTEVSKCNSRLKGCKAPGLDNLSPEMLKYAGFEVEAVLYSIILEAWCTAKAPAEFKLDILIPIPKKSGPVQCKDFRTLALQPVAAKVYAMLLRNRLSEWLQQRLLEPQCGFRPGRSCADAPCSLRFLSSLAWNKNKTLYICMLDLTKAFDSVNRDLASRILLCRGAPAKLVEGLAHQS